MTPDVFRRFALSQPEVVDVYYRGRSEFRVLRRSFASLGGPADSVAMVQLTSEQQAMFMRAEPRTFVPEPGDSGYLRATNVVLVCANEAIVESALVVAWRNIVPISRVKSADGSKIDGEIVDGEKGEQCISIHGADNTLKAICEEYIRGDGKNLRSAGWREQVLGRLVYPELGAKQIGGIKRSDVVRLLDKIEDENGATMADRTLAVVRKVMNWHVSRSDDFLSPIVRGMERLKPEERARERTLTDDELRAVWRAAEASAGPFGRLVRFILLTAARRSEAAAMTWGELNEEWMLPASRNKTKVDLVRPLSAEAWAVLPAKVVGCPFVFTTEGTNPISGYATCKSKLDKQVVKELRYIAEKQNDDALLAYITEVENLMARMAKTKGHVRKKLSRELNAIWWTLHDLRRTARSLMSRAGVPADHTERCLGHVMPRVSGVYDPYEYLEEKRDAFNKLAASIKGIVHPSKAAAWPAMRLEKASSFAE
jgi:integrase